MNNSKNWLYISPALVPLQNEVLMSYSFLEVSLCRPGPKVGGEPAVQQQPRTTETEQRMNRFEHSNKIQRAVR